MENSRISTTIVLVLVSLKIGFAEIVTKPTSTEVVADGSTFLNCSTNIPQEIHWFHTPLGSNQDRNFVYGYDQFYSPYIGRFHMEKNEANGAYNLVIPSVKVEDSGVYECQDETGRGKKESAQLIVLDSDPVCEPQIDTHEIIGPNKCGIEPNQVILSCTVKYKGNEAPILAWRRASDNITVSEGMTHETIDNTRVMYNLTIKGNSTVKDGDSYFCNTTRSAISNDGCKSGKTRVTGSVVDCTAVDATEICKPYSIAIICIIVLPIVIIGFVLLVWYLRVYRPKKRWQRALKEVVIKQELVRLNRPTTSQATAAEEAKEENSDYKSPVSSQDKNEQKSSKTNDLKIEIKILRELITEKDIKISTLEKATVYTDKIKDQSEEIEKLHVRNKALDSEIVQLKAKMKELEQHLYPAGTIDYAEKPTLAHTIITDSAAKEQHKPINGMTILGQELFVLHENSSVIEVYDSETFQLGRNWEIKGMSNPVDIASCKIANCLYIILREDNEPESHIVNLDPKGQLIKEWSTGGQRGRLSTYESNVIVCLFEKQLIKEYTRDGNLIQTVSLSPAVGFNHPWHAIKLTSSHFAVCHGDTKDELHRVCIVDAEGNIIKQVLQGISNKLDVPICLVEDSERAILVADRDNKKIRLLNCFLKCERSLIKQDTKQLDHCPVRICLDETKGRLFVAENALRSNKKEWKDGRILIFNI